MGKMSSKTELAEDLSCREIAFVFHCGTLNQMASIFPVDHKVEWLCLAKDTKLRDGTTLSAGSPFLKLALSVFHGRAERERMVAYLLVQSQLLQVDPEYTSDLSRMFLELRRKLVSGEMCSAAAVPYLSALMKTIRPEGKRMLDEAEALSFDV